MNLTREFYVPKGALCIRDKQSSAVAYLYETDGIPKAVAFHGKAQKPDWHFRFKDAAGREKRIRQHFEAWQQIEARGKAKQQERRAFQHPYKPGDIFRSSWGYEQTNIDYYEVVEVRGKHLIVRELLQGRKETEWCQGKCVPLPGEYKGEPFRVLAQDGHFKVGHQYAWFEKPTIVAGVPTYGASHWTSYA
jgi:hypothetical protein